MLKSSDGYRQWKSEVGRNLTILRKKRRYSRARLSAETGISMTTIYKIESGFDGVGLYYAQRICAVLGTPVSKFIGDIPSTTTVKKAIATKCQQCGHPDIVYLTL